MMNDEMNEKRDEGLVGNEKIEADIASFQAAPTEENLAVLLTTIRKRMKEKGQFVVAVEPTPADTMRMKVLQLSNGQKYIPVYTGFEEEMKSGNKVISTFLADMGQVLEMAYREEELSGILLNPMSAKLLLNKAVIRAVLG